MPFQVPVTKVRTSIGDIDMQIHDASGEQPGKSIVAQVAVLDQNQEHMQEASWSGDLLPHITQDDITWLLAFQDRMRTKANIDLLPQET